MAETGRRAGRSPGTVKNKLHLIDQNDAIYRVNGKRNVQTVFDIDQAPDGLARNDRQAALNIAAGPSQNTMYVAFTSRSEPTTDTPIYRMPAPLAGVCCNVVHPQPILPAGYERSPERRGVSFVRADPRGRRSEWSYSAVRL